MGQPPSPRAQTVHPADIAEPEALREPLYQIVHEFSEVGGLLAGAWWRLSEPEDA
jgi:hypothetical protein